MRRFVLSKAKPNVRCSEPWRWASRSLNPNYFPRDVGGFA